MYKYEHFIPENIAPVGAKNLSVYNSNGQKICEIPLGRLQQPKKNKLYSFGALSDVHITYDTANTDFQRALTFIENSDCLFTCICGDLTDNGTASQLSQYKSIVDTYAKTKPVYAMAGNHENYDIYNIVEQYTGKPLYYSFTQGNDVFIMVGHAGGYRDTNWVKGEQFTVAELQWLYEILETNRNKRCFVFCHVFPHSDGVGNANGSYTNDMWTSTNGTVFENLMKHYKNTVLFHGHSHFKFDLQSLDNKANYSSKVGYRSVHIPSLSVPRDVVDGSLSVLYAESEGYIVDVYDDYIILNGRDFIDNEADGNIIPIATYKIDTTLVNIEANTFTDSTGTITT
jgi:predicted phosphodiesterase